MVSAVQHINPAGLNDPSYFGYTHVTVVPPGAKLVYVAGQLGEDETGKPVADDFESQLKQAFLNLHTALAAVGATPEQVVKITILSVHHDAEKQQLISKERNAFWQGMQKPASTLIPVAGLAVDGMLFEIDAIAVIADA